MTQIIVTIEDNSPVALIKKAISLLRGVKRVVVQKVPEEVMTSMDDLSDVSDEIRSLIGVASSISENDISNDDKLAYILSK